MLIEIEKKIYVIRGVKVMLDVDLAELYGVETKILNQAVKRNLERFPSDFMFQLENHEVKDLRSQNATANLNHMSRVAPFAFSENGVAMLSSVLNSSQAIQVNIAIMRIFTRMRSFMLFDEHLNSRLTNLETGSEKIFKIVFERLDSIEESLLLNPHRRKKIGLK
jgi:hypothetical protein